MVYLGHQCHFKRNKIHLLYKIDDRTSLVFEGMFPWHRKEDALAPRILKFIMFLFLEI